MDPQTASAPPPPPGFVPMNQDSSRAGGAPPPPAGFQPINGSPAAPQQTVPAQPFGNEKGEGLYHMTSPDGRAVLIPFTKVKELSSPSHPSGYTFSDSTEAAKFAKDFRSAPITSVQDLLDGIDELPNWTHYVPGMQPVQQAVGGVGEMAKTVQGARKISGAEPKTPDAVTTLAQHQPANIQQQSGAMEEQGGEYVSAGELLGLLGGGAKALTEAGRVAQTLQRFPQLARILKVGMNAVQKIPEIEQAVLGAGQTFVKTGGDTRAALTAGAETAAAGGVLRAAGAAGAAVKTARAGAPSPEVPGAAEYAEQARAAAKSALEAVNEANAVPQTEVKMNQPAGAPAVGTGRTVATATGKAAPPQINVDQLLRRAQDFTGASDRMNEALTESYNRFDAATGGKFKTLNSEIGRLQTAAWKGEEGAAAEYKNKLAEMSALIDSTGGEITPEMKDAVKAGVRQSYLLKDFGDAWDRNLNGVPGGSKASQAQRGIDGKGLMKDLQRAVKTHGRPAIDAALGPDGLDNLEQIARANQTAAQRVTFNKGIWQVVRHLHHGAILGGMAGGVAGHWEAGAALGTASIAGVEAYTSVVNALKTNPKIGQNFLFALESGATPEKYGPFIAEMIQKANTDASREQAEGQE